MAKTIKELEKDNKNLASAVEAKDSEIARLKEQHKLEIEKLNEQHKLEIEKLNEQHKAASAGIVEQYQKLANALKAKSEGHESLLHILQGALDLALTNQDNFVDVYLK